MLLWCVSLWFGKTMFMCLESQFLCFSPKGLTVIKRCYKISFQLYPLSFSTYAFFLFFFLSIYFSLYAILISFFYIFSSWVWKSSFAGDSDGYIFEVVGFFYKDEKAQFALLFTHSWKEKLINDLPKRIRVRKLFLSLSEFKSASLTPSSLITSTPWSVVTGSKYSPDPCIFGIRWIKNYPDPLNPEPHITVTCSTLALLSWKNIENIKFNVIQQLYMQLNNRLQHSIGNLKYIWK